MHLILFSPKLTGCYFAFFLILVNVLDVFHLVNMHGRAIRFFILNYDFTLAFGGTLQVYSVTNKPAH